MLKKIIKYENFNGQPAEEEFYFNLTEAEIAEMELSLMGGLGSYLKEIVAKKNSAAVIQAFKDILTKAIGKKSEDGSRFVKNAAIVEDFLSSPAYSALFMELVTDAEASAAFIRGIVPQRLAGQDTQTVALPEQPSMPQLSPEKLAELSGDSEGSMRSRVNEASRRRLQDLSREELLALTPADFARLQTE